MCQVTKTASLSSKRPVTRVVVVLKHSDTDQKSMLTTNVWPGWESNSQPTTKYRRRQ